MVVQIGGASWIFDLLSLLAATESQLMGTIGKKESAMNQFSEVCSLHAMGFAKAVIVFVQAITGKKKIC